jgi:hypothetical protein
MIKQKILVVVWLILWVAQGCGYYSFTGASVAPNINTFQVNFFRNNAPIIEPGIDREFTQRLQDLISSQTRLNLTNNNGDLIYEGEIVDFYISPMTATAQNTAAQNRLTIVVNVRFYDTKNPENDLEQRFSFYSDYPAQSQLVGAVKENALDEIFERLTQDIFSATLAKW